MVRKIRYRDEHPSMSMVTLRRLERVRNVAKLIAIRDDPGDGSPARDTVRLAACRRLELPALNRARYLRRVALSASAGQNPWIVIRLPAPDPAIDPE
jgi:hypothetical protein